MEKLIRFVIIYIVLCIIWRILFGKRSKRDEFENEYQEQMMLQQQMQQKRMQMLGLDQTRDHYFSEMVGTMPGGRN